MIFDMDIIAIDGPVASGKGSVSSRVAKELGFHVLDSGALYRLTAYNCLASGRMPDKEDDALWAATHLAPLFQDGKIYLEGQDVTDAIRAENVGIAASKVAVFPSVRQALFALQRSFAKEPGLVADGRDMGSVVFPEACLKIFLTCSAEARAQRRLKQLKEKGISSNISDLVRDLKERDERDMNRATAPLRAAEGARVLDSSHLTLDETVSQVLVWYSEIRSGRSL